jgi:hypothetical protein
VIILKVFTGPRCNLKQAATRSISIPHSNLPSVHQFIHKPSPGSQSFIHRAIRRPVVKTLVIINLKSILNLFLPSQIFIGTTRTHTTRTVEHDIVRLIIRNQPPVLPIIHPAFSTIARCSSSNAVGVVRQDSDSCHVALEGRGLPFESEFRCAS